MSELHERIREAADEVGGLKRLSELANIPRRTIGHWLKGKQPKPDVLTKVAEVTGVSVAWLVSDRGGKHESSFSRATRRLDTERLPTPAEMEEAEATFSRGIQHLDRLQQADQLDQAQRSREAPMAAGLVPVPRFDVRASAGAGALVEAEDAGEYFAVGRDWLRRNLPGWAPLNSSVGVLDGSGDSMEPTIRDGDTLVIVRDVEWRIVERGGIFVFSLDDRLLLKRLQVLENGDLRVISDNKAYDPFIVNARDVPHRIIIHGQVFFAGGKPRSF